MTRAGMLLASLSLLSASAAAAAPLSKAAWPECRTLKPGVTFEAAALILGGRGRRSGFKVVDQLPVVTYAFRRAAHTCRVQIEEGMVLAQPSLR